jgi:hypothetical protein
LSMMENRLQRLCFAQQYSRCPGGEWTKCHDRETLDDKFVMVAESAMGP